MQRVVSLKQDLLNSDINGYDVYENNETGTSNNVCAACVEIGRAHV